MRGDEGLPAERPGVLRERAEHSVEAGLDPFLGELVAFWSGAGCRGRNTLGTGECVAEAEYRPISLRQHGGVPGKSSLRIHLRGEIHDFVPRDAGLLWYIVPRCAVETLHVHPVVPGPHECLATHVANAMGRIVRIVWRGKSHHGDVPIVALHGLWLGEHSGELQSGGNACFARHHHLHRFFQWHPWSTAAAPARTVVHIDLDAQPARLVERMGEQLLPFPAHHCDRSRRHTLVNFKNNRAAYTRTFHRLEILGDPHPRDVAVVPEPKHPRAGRIRRRDEMGFQRIGSHRQCDAGYKGHHQNGGEDARYFQV